MLDGSSYEAYLMLVSRCCWCWHCRRLLAGCAVARPRLPPKQPRRSACRGSSSAEAPAEEAAATEAAAAEAAATEARCRSGWRRKADLRDRAAGRESLLWRHVRKSPPPRPRNWATTCCNSSMTTTPTSRWNCSRPASAAAPPPSSSTTPAPMPPSPPCRRPRMPASPASWSTVRSRQEGVAVAQIVSNNYQGATICSPSTSPS